ncbi:hypothetical protein RF11_00249 [Thelohanellus kitauei]|uniref:Uncharacterized protein n=1 Tax=Thelohanellus kitauei TaxID=669202 RepID=A0A0C2MEM9_THEKT|nr:hypothetical protein RF11_00249 [Thelohanellus kitauei]
MFGDGRNMKSSYRKNALVFILLLYLVDVTLSQSTPHSIAGMSQMMKQALNCMHDLEQYSICDTIVPYDDFMKCLPRRLHPIEHDDQLNMQAQYAEVLRKTKIRSNPKPNSIAHLDDDIVDLYSRSVPDVEPWLIFRFKWQEFIDTLNEKHPMNVTQNLAAYCYSYSVSEWIYRVTANAGRLHENTDMLLKERKRDGNSGECSRLLVEARFGQHELTYWLIVTSEESRRDEHPYLGPLLQKMLQAVLPKTSPITPAIMEYVKLALPVIESLYQADRYLTVQEVTSQIPNDPLRDMIEGTQTSGVNTHPVGRSVQVLGR